MTKLLTLDEMREVIEAIDPKRGAYFADAMRLLGDLMASDVARLANVECDSTTVEPQAFAGTATRFYRIKGKRPHKAIMLFDYAEPLERRDE